MSAIADSSGSESLIVQVGYYAMSKGMAYEKWKGDSILRMIDMATSVQSGMNSPKGANAIDGIGVNIDMYI